MRISVRVAISVAFICSFLMGTTAYAQGSLLYVSNTTGDNSVSVYTTNADGTLTSAGPKISTGGLNPVYVAVRPDQAFAYVPNSNSRDITIIDTATQTVVGSPVSVSAASDVLGLVLTPDGSKVFASTRASLTQTIRVFNVDNLTGQLTPSVAIPVLQGPRGLAMTPDGSKLVVVNQSAQSLTIIGVATSTILATVSTGAQPINVAVNSTGTRAYVTEFSGPSVGVYDTTTLATIATVPTGVGQVYGIALTPDDKYYYVSTRADAKVHAYDANTFAEIGSGFSTGGTQGDIVISPDGLSLYVGSAGTDDVSMFTIDPATGSLTAMAPATIGAGTDPTGAAICRYGNSMLATGRIFVANTTGAISCMGSTPTFTGGTLRINGSNFTSARAFALGSGGGVIDTNGNSATFSGVLSGATALTKIGAGTLTLSASNTYTGGTTVEAGTLNINGTVASTITVRSGASIGGSGTVNGDVILEAGATYLGGLTVTGAVGSLSSGPEIYTVTPAQIAAGSAATTITVFGANFVNGSTIRVGSTTMVTTFRDASLLTATLPSTLLASGAVLTISVVNPAPGGGTSNTRTVTVANPVPTITSVSPAYFVASSSPSATTLVLLGTNFVSSSVVRVNGSVRAFTLTNSSRISVPLVATDLASVGILQITVQNPTPGGGTATAAASVLSSADVKALSLSRGITTLQSDGTSSVVTTGYTSITPSTGGGSVTPAFARLAASRGGVVISETSEPAVVPTISGRAFVQVGGSVNTGIAIANPNPDPVAVSFVFTGSSGQTVGSGSVTVPAGGQTSQFVSDSPFNLPANTEATLTFSSVSPVAVTVVRGTSNSKGDFLTSVMPVTDLSAPLASGVVAPSFNEGGGWSTSVVLTNPTSSVLYGTLQFIDKDSSQPLTLTVNGTLSNQFYYFLPARASTRFTTSGTAPALSTGWVRVFPGLFAFQDPSIAAVLSRRTGTDIVAETGISGVPVSPSAVVYAESSGNMLAATPGSTETNLVISNASTTTATVTVAFSVINGVASNVGATIAIPPGGQVVGTPKQIIGFAFLPNPLQGILRISALDPTQNIAVAAFRNRYNERGELIVSALPPLPTSPLPADTPLIVPQIVDGGGYKTSLILVSDSATAVPVQIRTVGPNGQSLPSLLK
jgi:autotransporter-associated beta strand protein/YVTN family beta-propeller protein